MRLVGAAIPPAAGLRLFVELLEGLSILGLPRGKSVRAPAVYDDRRRRWARKLGILCEDQERVFLDEGAVCDELFAPRYDIWIAFGRRALVKTAVEPRNTTKPFAVRCPRASAPLIRQTSTPPG
jgi:hypothetical protein